MKKVYLSLLTSCFILVTSSLSAELDRVLDDVLTTNPLIKQKMSNYEQTVYDLKIAKSEYLPKLDYIGRLGYEKTLEQVGGANDDRGFNTYRNSLVLTQNLFNGLKTVNRVNYEEARVMAAAYNYVEQTNDVAFNVIRQYINVLKFKDLYNLEKENVGLTRAILEKTQSLSDAGSGSISDVEKVGASLQLAEFNLLTQENNLMDSQFNLARLTGKRIDKDELILPKFTFDLPKTKDEAVSHAIKFNPSIIVANHNIETAKAQLAQNKGKFAPTIDFELAYNLDKNTGGDEGHERNYSALIVYRQNLYNGQADYNSVKKSKVAINQEYEIQGDIKRQIIEGLELSWSAYTMLQKQIVFLTSYQEQSRITLELYKEEFETGTRSLIDLLTAEDDYISARNKLITANYDLLFAKYRVLDAMGELVNSIYKDSSLNYYKPVFANYENVTDGKVIDRTDLDKDGVKDQQDLCDNTSLGIKVDMFGCEREQKEQITETVPVPVTNSINNPQNSTSVDSDINKKSGFVINLATFSSKEEVDKFIKDADLSQNSKVLDYVTQEHKRQLYKVVSNFYESKKSAYEALSKMSVVVKENKPYIESVEKLRSSFKNYN